MKTEEKIKFFPLATAQNIIAAATGLEVTHVFEDLVFVEHSAFLFQFDKEKDSRMNLYFNTECEELERKNIEQTLHSAAQAEGVMLYPSGYFTLSQVEGKEELTLTFS